jgi:hypothetical protein
MSVAIPTVVQKLEDELSKRLGEPFFVVTMAQHRQPTTFSP